MGKNSKSNRKHCGIKVINKSFVFCQLCYWIVHLCFFSLLLILCFCRCCLNRTHNFLLYCWPNSYLFLSLCPYINKVTQQMTKFYQSNCVFLAQLLTSPDGFQGTGFISLGLYIPKPRVFFSLARVNQELFSKSLTQFWSFTFSCFFWFYNM